MCLFYVGRTDKQNDPNNLIFTIDNITLLINDEDKTNVSYYLTLSNSSYRDILIYNADMVITAVPRSGGMSVRSDINIFRNVNIMPGSIMYADSSLSMDGSWINMTDTLDVSPNFNDHIFSYYLNLQGRSSDGKTFWLDIDVDQPVAMSCETDCISTFDAEFRIGGMPYVTCSASLGAEGFESTCRDSTSFFIKH